MAEKIKLLIGRREKVSFLDLQLLGIDAKVDTGAYSNALHCHEIEVRQETGKLILYFKLLDPSHPEYNEQLFRFEDFTEKQIKNSFGDLEKRYVIKTRLGIGPKIVKTSISLTDRGQMRYPVLIGRKLLKRRFIVDVNEMYLLSRQKKS